jgi:hypothetical protein
MKLIIFLFLLSFSFSCSNLKASLPENYCIVKFDSLMLKVDTSNVEIDTFSFQDSIVMRDKSVKKGEGSVFHFDKSGRLGLYAFMYDWPFTGFMILYDSVGKKYRLQDDEVVQWRYDKVQADSILNLTVLLCAVDRNYGELVLSAGSFCDSSIQLYNSTFTKVICFKSKVPLKGMPANSHIYLKGSRGEKCSGQISSFKDSLSIQDL